MLLDWDLPHLVGAWGLMRTGRVLQDLAVRLLAGEGPPLPSAALAALGSTGVAHDAANAVLRLLAKLPVAPRLLESLLGGASAVCAVWFYMLYKHAARVFMNRSAPHAGKFLWTMFWLIRPAQSLFRLLTAPLRVTPDIVIVGEVRCGTTTTARYLEQLPGAHRPFCMWRVDFADNKESFYLTGCYMGLIHPFFYRMCFPTIFEKLWSKYVLGKGFFTYDACAQYATAPWVPALIKRTNPDAKIVFCLREPVSQNVSWWNFESAWVAAQGEMGTGEFAPGRVPAPTMRAGWDAALSEDVQGTYNRSEECTGPLLPDWACTWPKGQSRALARNGVYAENIKRYLKHFPMSQISFVNQHVDLAAANVPETVRTIASLVPDEQARSRLTDEIVKNISEAKLHANANAFKCPSSQDPVLLAEMKAFYKPHNEELQRLIGRDLQWK